MKFNLFQEDGAPATEAGRCVEPGEAVQRLQRLQARIVRAGTFDIQVDVAGPQQLEEILGQLEGWQAEPVQVTDNATGYEGMLRHMRETRKR